MYSLASESSYVGGRLALDFANHMGPGVECSWEGLLEFLLATKVISAERSAQLLELPDSDPQSASVLLVRARRLQGALQAAFGAMIRKEGIARAAIEPINEVLRITEGHDELTLEDAKWRLEFVAREGGLEWLLAAIARSGAEIISEGARAPLHVCANPACGLLFYDTSRTHKRRWCSMARCGNRHKVAAFSRRHAAGQG